MLDLLDKGFKSAILNMFKKLKHNYIINIKDSITVFFVFNYFFLFDIKDNCIKQ